MKRNDVTSEESFDDGGVSTPSTRDIGSGSVSIPGIFPDDELHGGSHSSERECTNDDIKRLQLSFPKKVLIGSGHILNDLCASLWFSYLLLYLQNVVNLSSDYSAYLMLLGQIVDGVATPLIGYEADRSDDCFFFRKVYKDQRIKKWHLFGIILVTLSFPFVFSPCIGCDGASDFEKLIYYAPFIAIFQIGWASTQISHLALIPKMHPDELVRTELLSIRYGFTVASNITVFILAWQTFGFDGKTIDKSDEFKFRNVALMAVGIGMLFSVIFHVFVKEEADEHVKKCVAFMSSQSRESSSPSSILASFNSNERAVIRRNIRGRENDRSNEADDDCRRALLAVESDDEERIESQTDDHEEIENTNNSADNILSSGRGGRGQEIEIRQPNHFLSTKCLSLGKENMTTKDWLTLPQFYLVALVYMATRMSVNVTQVYIPLYLTLSLKLPSGSVATIPLTMYIAGFLVALFMKLINKYIGRQLAYILGAALTVMGSMCVLFVNWHSSNEYLNTYGIYGVAALLGGGASAILITSLSITADLIGNNVESGAFVYGAMSFTDKLSCGLSVMFINSVVPCQKDDSADCSKFQEGLLIPFYRNVLAYASGGCALLGVVGVILLTVLIFVQYRRRTELRRNLEANFLDNSTTEEDEA